MARLYWLFIFTSCMVLAAMAFSLALSYGHYRVAATSFYLTQTSELSDSERLSPNSLATRHSAIATNVNPFDSIMWLLRASYVTQAHCNHDVAACELRTKWLTKAVQIRPMFGLAWAQLSIANLEAGSVTNARNSLHKAYIFAPHEFETGIATLRFSLSQWHTLSAAEKEMAVSTFATLFNQSRTRFLWFAEAMGYPAPLTELAANAEVLEIFEAAKRKQISNSRLRATND